MSRIAYANPKKVAGAHLRASRARTPIIVLLLIVLPKPGALASSRPSNANIGRAGGGKPKKGNENGNGQYENVYVGGGDPIYGARGDEGWVLIAIRTRRINRARYTTVLCDWRYHDPARVALEVNKAYRELRGD